MATETEGFPVTGSPLTRGGGGFFITCEGTDGSGKSTSAIYIAKELRRQGRDVVLTREPGGSEGAEQIRSLLVEGETGRWSAETELLLFTAARRDHMERVILPGLARGAIVVCDRFVDSSRVYQGLRGGGLRSLVDHLQALMIGVEPDLTLVFDIDPKTALNRVSERDQSEARFESFGADFQAQLREGFRALQKAEPKRCKLIDGNRCRQSVQADVMAAVENRASAA